MHCTISTMSHSPGVVSIGYEGRTADELIASVVAAGVDVLVDVRLNPISRKPGLSKTKLAAALHEAGVDYLHLRTLGNPRENRDPFWSGRVAEGVQHFRTLMTAPEPTASLDELALLAQSRRVAVLCFERDHDKCHRQVVTDNISSRIPDTEVVFA